MLYAYPIGGLGNMFFHIASIWTLAKDNGDDLCLLNIDHKINELDHGTNITLDWNSTKHSNEYRYFLNRFKQSNGYIFNQVHHPYNYTPIEYKKEHQYFGYFQSEKYFKHRRNEILDLFKPSDKIVNEVNKYSHLFDNISLHIRRSWISLNLLDVFVVQTIDYYNNAISILPKDLKILVFSDDIEWCKQNFIGDRFIFIDEVDYISIYLMSKMKYHINANSTFSWWGAWMSYSEKIIVPSRWFIDEYSHIGAQTVPDNWITI